MRSIQWLGLIMVALLVASTSPVLGYGFDYIGGAGSDANDSANWLEIPAQGYYGMYWNDNGLSTHGVPTLAWAFPTPADSNNGKVFIRNGASATIGSGVQLGCRDTWCVGGFEIKYGGTGNNKFLDTSSSLLIQAGGSMQVANGSGGKFDAGTKYTGTITNYGNITVGSTQLGGKATFYGPDAADPNTFDNGTSSVVDATGNFFMKGGVFTLTSSDLAIGGNGGTGNYTQDAGTVTTIKGIIIGHKSGTGLANISGGTIITTANSETRIGGADAATNTVGTGTLNLSGTAYVELNQSTTKLNQVGVTTNAAATADGVGLVTVADSAILKIGTGDGTSSLSIGHSTAAPTGAGRAKGKVEINGTGTLLAAKAIAMGRNSGQGTFKVGKDATVIVGGIDMATNATATSIARIEGVIAGAADFSQIDCNDGAFNLTGLGTRQIYMALSGYRPLEGQTFDLLTNAGIASNDSSSATVTTNVTAGNAGFTGAKAVIDGSHEVFRLTFTGLTAGDADGSHTVDGGDLAIMGGNWNASSMAWANGDFNGDGVVDGGDLAIMGANWNWGVAPAPVGGEVPEPMTMTLLGLGGLALIRRKR